MVASEIFTAVWAENPVEHLLGVDIPLLPVLLCHLFLYNLAVRVWAHPLSPPSMKRSYPKWGAVAIRKKRVA
jgi:hypothetical protein